jgi:PHD/YefM family antitoxin component YafN of YafNO toxin-antitoxin module
VGHVGEAFVGVFRGPRDSVNCQPTVYPDESSLFADKHHLPAGGRVSGVSVTVCDDDMLFLVVPHMKQWPIRPAELQALMSRLWPGYTNDWQTQIAKLLRDTRATLIVASVGRRSEARLMPFKIINSGEFGKHYSKTMQKPKAVRQVSPKPAVVVTREYDDEEEEVDFCHRRRGVASAAEDDQEVIVISDNDASKEVIILTDSEKAKDSEEEEEEEDEPGERERIGESGSEAEKKEKTGWTSDSQEEFIRETGSEKEEDRLIRLAAGSQISDLLAAARELSSSNEPAPKRPRLDDGLMQLRMVTSRQQTSTNRGGNAGTTSTSSRSSTIIRLSIPMHQAPESIINWKEEEKGSKAALKEEEREEPSGKKELSKKRNRGD